MGYFKQLHIDCYEGTCIANNWDTCYMQPDNPSYNIPESDGDYDPYFDHDRDDTN